METLNKILVQMKVEKLKQMLRVGSKRQNDIEESFEACINILLDFGALLESEKAKATNQAFKEGVEFEQQSNIEFIKKIILQLETKIPE